MLIQQTKKEDGSWSAEKSVYFRSTVVCRLCDTCTDPRRAGGIAQSRHLVPCGRSVSHPQLSATQGALNPTLSHLAILLPFLH